MFRTFCALLTFIVLVFDLALCNGRDESKESPNDAIEGTWRVAILLHNNVDWFNPKDHTMQFVGDRIVFATPTATTKGRFRLDMEKDPHHIDIDMSESKDKVLRRKSVGIFRIDGAKLEICVGPPDSRPDSFDFDNKDYTYLMLYKHALPEEADGRPVQK